MTNHRSSIPLDAGFTPPPAIVLGPARRIDRGVTAAPDTDQARDDECASGDPSMAAREPAAAASAHPLTHGFSLRKRLAALLAFLAVPAMAAPGDFGALAGDAPAETALGGAAAQGRAMAFEQPGQSFPGSAFYYLADPPRQALVALPDSDPFEIGPVGGQKIGSLVDAGPAARAFFAGGGLDTARAQDCLAQAIWYEAASESEAGQRAVAQVVLNRVAHPAWPSSVCGVVYEGSSRSTGCQFTFTCDGSLVRRKPGSLRGSSWERAQTIAREALSGSVYAPIGHATHYHTLWVDPYWAGTLDPIGVIGAHRFYRNRGNAGEKSAFSARYAGVEPLVSPRAMALAGEDLAGGPTGLAPRPALETTPAARSAVSAVPPAGKPSDSAIGTVSATATGGANAGIGQARKEFARAGQWKVDPATLRSGSAPKTGKPADQPNADTGAAPSGNR